MSSQMEKLLIVLLFCRSLSAIESANDVIIDVKSGHTVEVRWRPSSVNDDHVIGHILDLIPLSSRDFLKQQNNEANNETELLAEEKFRHVYLNKSAPVHYELSDLLPGATYQVQIHSEHSNKSVTLLVKSNFTTKPNPPSGDIFCHYSVQNINVMWEPPLQPSFFTKYRVSISPPDDPKSVIYTEKETQTTVFVDLTPGRAYNISVQSVSGSQASDPLVKTCRTQPSVPTRVECDPQTLNSFSFDIKWGLPRYQSDFDSYLVIKDDNLYKKVTKSEPRSVHISEDIKPGKTYKIEIITRSDQISSKPFHLFVTTRPLPVYDLMARPAKDSDIYVEWKAGIGSTQDSYLVTSKEVMSTNVSAHIVANAFTQLTHLLPGHNYSIEVVALSNNISSNITGIYQPTRPAQPLFQGASMNFQSHLILSWRPNPISDQDSYRVAWTRVDSGETGEEIQKQHKSENSRELYNTYDFGSLYSGAKYMMNVSAIKFGLVSEPLTYFHTVAPKPPHNVRITDQTNSSLVVQWSAPKDSLVDHYIIRVRPENQTFWRQLSPNNKTSVEIKNLTSDHKLFIKLTSVSYSVESYEQTINETLHSYTESPIEDGEDYDPYEFVEGTSQHGAIISSVIVILIMVVSIISAGIYSYNMKNRTVVHEEPVKPEEEPLKKEEPVYIDQSIEIDRKDLAIEHEIGHGQFGSVHFGLLTVRNGRLAIPVAIKMSNVISHERDVKNFLKEAFIMKNFRHVNVLTLIGVSFETNGSPLVVLPFMKNGDLLSYVRNEKNHPTVKQLMTFAIDVAKGMEYLSKQNFIHRDLAARNCMLDNDLTAKVADFGLSKDLIAKNYYRAENYKQLMPIKWMAIESLEKGIYDNKTDVWSFGVLVWELMTRGIIPYPNLQCFEVLPQLKSGHRLPKPNYCPESVYAIIWQCWLSNPKDRPTFTELSEGLDSILDDLEHELVSEAAEIESVSYCNYPITYTNAIA